VTYNLQRRQIIVTLADTHAPDRKRLEMPASVAMSMLRNLNEQVTDHAV
jgi:hypothetical protein